MEQPHKRIPELKALQLELAGRLLNLGAFLNMGLGDDTDNFPGNRALGLESDSPSEPWHIDAQELDTQRFRVGRILTFLYDYAYHARRAPHGTIDWDHWDEEFDDREIFEYFLQVTDQEGIQEVNADNYVGGKGLLWPMIELADARHRLDAAEELSIKDIAVLAEMNEKSVKNALHADGDNRLHSEGGELVRHEEALRWLRSRRGGFKETVVASFDVEDLPDSLSYSEIPAFIRHRLAMLFPQEESSQRSAAVANTLGWPVKRVDAVTEDTGNIRPEYCPEIARAIRVDPAWFTEQVMCALFPKQMALVLYRKEFDEPADSATSDYIEVPLTEKGIKNGYLDIPASLAHIFPSDSFGGRGKSDVGREIEIRYGGTARMTDIRRKSAVTISPRARFVSYFKSTLHAEPGDIMRIARIDERTFELTHLAGNQPTTRGIQS